MVVTVLFYTAFWQTAHALPQPAAIASNQSTIPGIVIKKQGDFPSFWKRQNSFIAAMDALYEKVKTKNRGIL